jgi:hypothetical protein
MKRMDDLDRRAVSTCQLGAETVHLLQYLTSSIQDPFVRPGMLSSVSLQSFLYNEHFKQLPN